MALTGPIVWRKTSFPNAYLKILAAADSHSVSICLGVFSCEESRRADELELYTVPFNVPLEVHREMFSEEALKAPNTTALTQSYEYLKTLEELQAFTDAQQ